MGNKIALILSFIFVIFSFLLGTDLIGIEMTYSNLDAVSISTGYMISKKGEINQTIIDYVYNETGGLIENKNISNNSSKIGDIFEYNISKYYYPFFINKEPIKITISRSVIIGQYV